MADAVAEFEAERSRLFGLAYRMLGSASEAEDVVQDAFVRWHGAGREDIESPRAWLTAVALNLCRSRLRSARARRERYVGTWLPEPVLTADGGVLALAGGTLVALFVPEISGGQITALRIAANPAKLNFAAAQARKLSCSEHLSGLVLVTHDSQRAGS